MAGVSYTSKLSEPNCYNWIKAALAVFITKEGIEPFVCKEIREFQWKCLSEICYNNKIQAGRVCSSCSTENVVVCLSDRKCNAGRGTCAYHRRNPTQYLTSGCPNSICHNFKHKIQAAHRYSGPSYKNTDARVWCTVPWEVAKCFMPPDGYKDKPSAKETDFNGINSVVINLTDFQAKISDDLSKRDNLFEKGREISRAVRHSPNLEVDDSDLQQYFSDLSSLLSDPKYLAKDPDAQFALKKLKQLQNDTLVIGKEEVRIVLDDIANAVKDKIRNEIDEQKKKAEEQKLELLIEIDKSVNAIKHQEKLSSSEVKSVLTDSLHAIDEKVKKGRERIKVKVQAGTKQIEFATDESVGKIRLEEQAVRSVVQAGTKQIEKAADDSVGKIRSEEKAIRSVVQAGTKQIEMAADVSVGKIRLKEKAVKSEGENLRAEIRAGRKLIETVTNESVRKIRSDAESEEITSDDNMRKLLQKGLQNDLISHYKETCSTLPICPCLEEVDASLVEFYIPPYPLYSKETDILKLISIQRKQSEEQNTEAKVDTLSGIFVKNSKDCRNIYITAEPGLGKTSLVKWLVLNWCQAHCPEDEKMEFFNENDVGYLRNFKFLFLVYLRGAAEKDDIDSMIHSQIIPFLGNKLKYTPKYLEDVLFKENCLIVMDGLDEWTSADKFVLIPKRSLREKSTYLTTCRPWKFSMLSLNSTEIDQHIQIKSLTNMCTRKLVQSLFSIFKKKDCLQENMQPETAAQMFIKLLYKKNLADVLTTPFMLLQMGFVWNQKRQIGNSFCEIYTEMVDVLLTIAEKKNPGLEKFKNKMSTDLQCFKSSSCESYFDFMLKVGKLAYGTLCSENAESTLVFEEAVAFNHLSGDISISAADILEDCLKIGVLSKEPLYNDAKRKRYTYSFQHKTIQEFFAAVFLQSMYERDSYTVEVLKRKCQSVAAVLEMGTVFKFLSGFNPKVAKKVLQSLQPVICRNTELYRMEIPASSKLFPELKSWQNMVVSCIIESTNNGQREQDFPLEDVIIDSSCSQVSYHSALNTLIKSNGSDIKSLSEFILSTRVFSFSMYRQETVLKAFELERIQSVVSLNVDTLESLIHMHHLLERSVQHLKCFKLGTIFPMNYRKDIYHSEGMKSLRTLKEAKQLVVLHINNTRVNRDLLETFLICISNNISLRDITLHISNMGPDRKCSDHNLELRHHSHLEKLCLMNVPVSQLQLNDRLQNLTMKHVPVSQLQLNDHLQNLTMEHVPVSQLQLNDHLQNLTMMHVPVSQLLLNIHLQNLTMEHVPVSQLQLNVHLQNLTMRHVPVSQLQLNDHLQNLTMEHVHVSQLQLNDHLQNLTMGHVPVSQLQLNVHLQNLTMGHVPVSQLQLNLLLQNLTIEHVHVSQLQLNDHLQNLTMGHVPVSQLQLNDHLLNLTMDHVPVSQLQLNVHLQNLTMRHVPVSQLQLNDHLQNLTMEHVPVSQLQLNDHLQNLTMIHVPVSQLQLNDHLQNLTMRHVPVSQFQLNDHLQNLTMTNVPVSQLQLNVHLLNLTMEHVPVSQLQLNVHLQNLTMIHVPVSQLQLNDHLQNLTMGHVPVSQLQLNVHLQILTMGHVPVSQLQLNVHLRILTMMHVPVSQLQLNDHLQNLIMGHVPVSQLQLNDHLKNLTMQHVPVSQLQLNDHLLNLTMEHVHVSQLQLNDHLQTLTMIHVPVSQLQLNDHLQKLTMKHVPVSQLQLNDHLRILTMQHVPVSQLQLNVHLQYLTMQHVPVSQLQLNDHLQNLTMEHVHVSQLQLNDHLQNLTMQHVPVSQLQLNDHLQNLTMEHVPVSQLQLNDQLQNLTMRNVPVSQLQLNDHLQNLTMEHVHVSQLQLNDQLQELYMEHVSVSQLQLNDQLQEIYLSNVKISLKKADKASSLKSCHLRGDVGTFIRDLAAAPNLDRLELESLTSESVMILLETLSCLLNVSEIYIVDTDISNRHFVITPDMTHLQCVRLFDVLMTSETFLEFIGSVLKCKNVIYTELKDCRVRDVTSSAQMQTEQGVMSLSTSPKEYISENGWKTFEVVLSHAGTSIRTLKDFVDMVQRSPSPVTVLLNKKEIDYFELIEYVRSSPFFTIQSEDDTSVTFMTDK